MKIYKVVLLIGIAAVMVFAPIARGAVRLWSMTPVMVAVYSLVFMWGMRVAGKNGDSMDRFYDGTLRQRRSAVGHFGEMSRPGTVPIFLFAMLAATSFAFSIYKHDSLYALLRLFAYIGLYFLIVDEFDHRMRKWLVWIAISVGAALSGYGLLQYCGLLSHSWWIPPEFLAATYVNHNHFAGYLEMVMPVSIAIIVGRQSAGKGLRNKIVLTAVLALMGTVFILTQSRGAWVSLGLSLLAMLFIIAGKRSGAARIVIILALLAVVAISLIYFTGDMMTSRLSTLASAGDSDDVSGGRFHIWKGAMGMIRERPLTGFGIGDFDAGFNRYRPLGFNMRAVYAHNDYLHMAAEMGVFAPLIMLWLFIVVVREGLRKRDRSPYAFGCAIGVMSLAVHGLVDFNFHIPANMILFTIWMAIAASE